MPVRRPTHQPLIHLPVQPVEGPFDHSGPVIVRPPPNDRIENRNQGRLRCDPVAVDDTIHLLRVPFDGYLRRPDERFEARFAPIGTGTILPYPVLPHVEAQKVKAW
jgi:hypothetical protein